MRISPEIQYMLVVLALFIVPRVLQRFRLPSAITCVGIGALLSIAFHAFHDDATVKLLATFGIVSLFLFAGLEVDLDELKSGRKVLLQHVAAHTVVLGIGAVAAHFAFGLEPRAALLLALAVLTPSTGFILDSLANFGLSDEERFWVKSKAIATELVALGVLFVAVQSDDPVKLSISASVLLGMLLLLPPVLHVFSRVIAPYAPNTEFTFLMILALLCAFVTRELGVYYLVGAFVVGVTAVRLRRHLPALSSEKLLGAVELFASFFIPFYFFKAGLHLEPENFTPVSLLTATALLGIVVPTGILRVAIHRKLALGEPLRTGARIGTAVIPTLVFTMVIADILRERFALSAELYGALIIFTLVNTTIPGMVLRAPSPDFEHHEVPRVPGTSGAPAQPQSSPPAA